MLAELKVADAAKHEAAFLSILDIARTSLAAATSDQPMPRAAAPRAVAGEVEAPAAPAPDDSTVQAPAAPAPDDLQAPAAPALDDSWSRVARFVGQGRPFFAKRTAAAVCMRVGTSQAFEEAVAARVEDHRKINFTTMRNVDGGSDLEAQTVIDMLTPDFRNLAVAELLGDAAPSASSPRALTHEELVAGLARFELGEVDAVHAEARNRIEARAAAPDAMQS
jgi:hypothetical protein